MKSNTSAIVIGILITAAVTAAVIGVSFRKYVPLTRENVEAYIHENRNRLIPIDPVLGGSWYVTQVDYDVVKKSGTFSFEDGHIAESAAFEVSETGRRWQVTLRDYITLGGSRRTGTVHGVMITFHTLVADNRCPIDVNCIEGGALTVNLTLRADGETKTLNKASDEVPLRFHGRAISIVRVAPSAISTKIINPGEYEVTFKVE